MPAWNSTKKLAAFLIFCADQLALFSLGEAIYRREYFCITILTCILAQLQISSEVELFICIKIYVLKLFICFIYLLDSCFVFIWYYLAAWAISAIDLHIHLVKYKILVSYYSGLPGQLVCITENLKYMHLFPSNELKAFEDSLRSVFKILNNNKTLDVF